MVFEFQVLLFAVLGCFSHGEVSDQFAKCRQFFYKGSPPTTTGDLTDICQFYKGSDRFASSYSTYYRIPVFSAYHLPSGSCKGQYERRPTWFVEPQVSNPSEPPQMDLARHRTDLFKQKQAIMKDYNNTGFDKGHVNPFFYQCDDGRDATFTLTNCVPQNPCFNQQIWKEGESQSKKIMDELCSYPCAKRYFVTGTVPTEKRIPDKIHDKVPGGREYNRVSVPSHMWTAACCDTTACTDHETKNAGFSYGYIGNNTADPYFYVLSVRKLEETLVQEYRYVHNVNFDQIFTDDKCNINEEKSKEAREMMKVPIAKKMTNEVYTMSLSQVSSLPSRKRKLISDEQRAFKSPKLSDVYENLVLSNADYAMTLTPDEAINTRNELRPEGFSLVKVNHLNHQSLPAISHFHSELKRAAGKNSNNQDWSVYNVVRKQSKDLDIAYDGKFCRYGHRCGKYGYSYTWCYTDWSDNWQYCCEDDCDFGGKAYTNCKINNGRRSGYCSQKSSLIPVEGDKRCLQDHPCGLYGEDFYWCYVDLKKNWKKCCQPWDPCRYRNHGDKKMCFTSREFQKDPKYLIDCT